MNNNFEQIQLSAPSSAQEQKGAVESISCCSRYQTCSEKKSCVIPDLDYSQGCIYRKQLEAGNIFFGKNSIEFHPDVYEKFKQRYFALSEMEVRVLSDLLHFSFVENRAGYSTMYSDNPFFHSLEKAGFIRLTMHSYQILNKCTFKAMVAASGSRIYDADKWAKDNCPPEEWAKRRIQSKKIPVKIKKDELRSWIGGYCPEVLAELSKGICFVEIDIKTFRELYEFFMDFLYQENYTCALDRCENDHRFFSRSKDSDEKESDDIQTNISEKSPVSTIIYGRCRFIQNWSDWDYTIHEDPAQIDRQGWAMTYPFSFEINRDQQTAYFSSTSDLPYYDTSLHKCNCHDFQKRQLPCKHIYRLAVELGIIEIIRRSSGSHVAKNLLDEIRNSEDIDSHPEQVKRMKKAKDVKMAPISIDYVTQTAIFSGSGKKPYETTVDSCTCRDYFVRRLPCKHIYRLRMELEKAKDEHQ